MKAKKFFNSLVWLFEFHIRVNEGHNFKNNENEKALLFRYSHFEKKKGHLFIWIIVADM